LLLNADPEDRPDLCSALAWPGPRTLACPTGEYGNHFDVRVLPIDRDGRSWSTGRGRIPGVICLTLDYRISDGERSRR
jgi:hypothetical protein